MTFKFSTHLFRNTRNLAEQANFVRSYQLASADIGYFCEWSGKLGIWAKFWEMGLMKEQFHETIRMLTLQSVFCIVFIGISAQISIQITGTASLIEIVIIQRIGLVCCGRAHIPVH